MKIRATETQDWMSLKDIRLAALLDIPIAFSVSYQTAIADSDEQWKQRASPETMPKFWLALNEDNAIGMIGVGLDQLERYNLIAMWVKSEFRGLGVGKSLVNAVKSYVVSQECEELFLGILSNNLKTSKFYLKLGFVFIDEEQPLAGHPEALIQMMRWRSLSQNN